LKESFGTVNHLVEFFPGGLRVAVNELLNFLELMNTENTPDVTAVRASLLTEAGGSATVAFREL